MKKILTYILVAMIIAPVLNSCKKGEDDPFLSLKSRDGRLEGEWVLKSVEGTQTGTDESTATYKPTDTDRETYTTIITYDGSKFKYVETTDFTSISDETVTCRTVHTYYEPATYSMTFDKNGSVITTNGATQNTTAGTFVISSSPANSGTSFSFSNPYGGGKTDGTYNETIETDYTSSDTDTEESLWYWGNSGKNKSTIVIEEMGTYDVLRLSSKELKLKYSYSSTSNSTYHSTGSFDYTSTDKTVESYEMILTFEKK
ncbi:MAG: hypothetical protein A2W91_16540 [Bacteroidetes bacterium GWF2_38_335]|nr:MAG: hypothetical protein A2W91_16540 [Bacteroidetes bacterium GWF2_38_335]OFY81296.1 MAG: hypothetical protein A2281_07515 [Bacteroidetes bacterium RIFOXYA12_FULL_38_20]HBS85416.1 hypothetical protein [Bacteroidales bacterium]